MDILQAAKTLHPGTDWNFSDGILSQAIDDKDRVSVPSQEELDAVMNTVAYKDLRRDAYPPVADLADALVHQANGDSAAMTAYVAACNAVKAQYPKP